MITFVEPEREEEPSSHESGETSKLRFRLAELERQRDELLVECESLSNAAREARGAAEAERARAASAALAAADSDAGARAAEADADRLRLESDLLSVCGGGCLEQAARLRVEVEEASVADEIFTKLMGERVEPRKEFIKTEARKVRNLDI